MKKLICLLLALVMVLSLAACGKKEEAAPKPDEGAQTQEPAEPPAPAEPEPVPDWSLAGFFQDDDGHMLSITWMDDITDPGWYVGYLNGEDFIEDSYGGTLAQDGYALKGELANSGSKDPLKVTVTENGEGGILIEVEGGESCSMAAVEMEEATIFVNVNIEGWGSIDYAEGEEPAEHDPEYPFQSAVINLAEPATYTLSAWPDKGSLFVKWTKDGEDLSTEPVITLLLDESAEYIAVFEDDPDWKHPLADYTGEYQSDRVHAQMDVIGRDEAWITITWGDSAWSHAQWDIVGTYDEEARTISYEGVPRRIVTYDDEGAIVSDEADIESTSGWLRFNEDRTVTWHDDQSSYGTDVVFEWVSELEY